MSRLQQEISTFTTQDNTNKDALGVDSIILIIIISRQDETVVGEAIGLASGRSCVEYT